VAGANDDGYHLKNVNYVRDYQADIVSDIAAAQEGDACPNCDGALRTVRGVEVGNIFKLGTRYSDSMGCYYLDKDGKEKPVIMGSYGIGSGRLLACVAEEHHDENGLIWPITVAPYHVYIAALAGRGADDVKVTADRLYQDLLAEEIEVLYDDREESPGVKFNDADLIGLPIRLTVSKRSLQQGGIEFKRRDSQTKGIIPQDQIIAKVKEEMDTMLAEIEMEVVDIPFDD
jgi:prolyl-tRNA synthetase